MGDWRSPHPFSDLLPNLPSPTPNTAMRPAAALLCAAILPSLAAAQTSFPMVTHVTPVAVQRGTTAEVTVDCRTSSLSGAYKVLVEGDGVAIEPLPPKEAPKVDPKSPVPSV